ncbi:hypothetical protein GGH95_001463 [Coemansia sp. RSA 1836]|nr:hypothetical protein GGH95_001463 [Coemansia sp. RSA 1836]
MATSGGKPQVWFSWGTVNSRSDIHARLHSVIKALNDDGGTEFNIEIVSSVYSLLHRPEDSE